MNDGSGKHFERLDRPEERVAHQGLLDEYREAYRVLSTTNPAAALQVPHPEDSGFDVANALEVVRRLNGGVKGVPDVGLQA